MEVDVSYTVNGANLIPCPTHTAYPLHPIIHFSVPYCACTCKMRDIWISEFPLMAYKVGKYQIPFECCMSVKMVATFTLFYLMKYHL